MSSIQGVTENFWRVTLTVDGVDYGVWDKMDGGDVDSPVSTFPPGGGGAPYALAAQQTIAPITLSRNYRLQRDHDGAARLRAKAGTGRAVVKAVPLDGQKNAYGQPDVYTGLLKTVTPPAKDSTSQNPAMLVCVIQPDGNVS